MDENNKERHCDVEGWALMAAIPILMVFGAFVIYGFLGVARYAYETGRTGFGIELAVGGSIIGFLPILLAILIWRAGSH